MFNTYAILFRNNHGAMKYCTFHASDAKDAVRQFFISHKSDKVDTNLICKLTDCLLLEQLIEIHNAIDPSYTITDIFNISLVEYSNHQNYQKED